MDLFLGVIIGGAIVLALVESRKAFKKVKVANKIHAENTKLRQEVNKIEKNEQDIANLKTIVAGQTEQILTCLDLLSSISTFKDQETLTATYVATLRFREEWGLKDESIAKTSPNTYTSDG